MPKTPARKNAKRPTAKPKAKPKAKKAAPKPEPGFMWKVLKEKQAALQSAKPGSKFFSATADRRQQAPQDVTYWNKFAGPRRRAG